MSHLFPAEFPPTQTIAIWRQISASSMIQSAFEALEIHIADVVSLHRPLCLASGRCCNFREHGHYLMVTGLEAAVTLGRIAQAAQLENAQAAREAGLCPFLASGSCSIHTVRPTGCRSYHCDRQRAAWQDQLSEGVHMAIRNLHDEHAIPYLCAEWTWMVEAFARNPA